MADKGWGQIAHAHILGPVPSALPHPINRVSSAALPRRGCRTAYPSVATGKGEGWITGGGRGGGEGIFPLNSTTSPQTREVVPALRLSRLQGWLTCALGECYFWRQFLPPSRETGSLLFLLCAADSSLASSQFSFRLSSYHRNSGISEAHHHPGF